MCGAVGECDAWTYGPLEPSENCWLVKGPVTYKAVANRNSGMKPNGSREVSMNVISIFGSSVSNGAFCSGNCSGTAYDPAAAPGGCYQSRLREYQAAYRGRSIFNNAHGGDTTTKLL